MNIGSRYAVSSEDDVYYPLLLYFAVAFASVVFVIAAPAIAKFPPSCTFSAHAALGVSAFGW
jgi:hypothetical protein